MSYSHFVDHVKGLRTSSLAPLGTSASQKALGMTVTSKKEMMTTTPPILSILPEQRQKLIERIFAKQNEQGLWKITDPTLPIQLYLPKHTATYHTLVTLADLGCDPADPRLELSLIHI